MGDESYAYVATEPCGCVTGAFADLERSQKDLALQIGEWILRGAKVDRRSTEWVKANFRPCEKHSKLKQLDLLTEVEE